MLQQQSQTQLLLRFYLLAEEQSRIAYIVCRIAQYASRTTQYKNGDEKNCPSAFLDQQVAKDYHI